MGKLSRCVRKDFLRSATSILYDRTFRVALISSSRHLVEPNASITFGDLKLKSILRWKVESFPWEAKRAA